MGGGRNRTRAFERQSNRVTCLRRLVGVPDGMGAMLYDEDTVRIIFQSESYGPIWAGESYPFIVNENGGSFTGSHVQYVDYDRTLLADFMTHGDSAYSMVKGSGNLIKTAYNLLGNYVGKRNTDSACVSNDGAGTCMLTYACS